MRTRRAVLVAAAAAPFALALQTMPSPLDDGVAAAAGADAAPGEARPASAPFVLGQRPFLPSSSWNTPIAPGATYTQIKWPAATPDNYGVAWSSYSPAIYVGSPDDPVVTVAYPPSWGYAGGEVAVRMPIEADGAEGTDGELLVIDGDIVHNFWQFKRVDRTTATAQAYAAADVVRETGWGSKSPFRGAGIVAAGSSQLAGLLVEAETSRGELAHALHMCVERSLAKPGFAGEAISGDGQNANGIVQQGERLAIPPGARMPSGLSPLGRKVFRAYQTYGVFVVDVAGGVTTLRAQANAYDAATIGALQRDLPAITPMLQRVR